jgi:uncharacterized protein YjiS (DUF1127 family)
MWAYTDEEIDCLSPGTTPAGTLRAGATPRATETAVSRKFSWSRFNPLHWLRVWRERENAREELYQLDQQSLADLGINPGDFHAILRGTYRRGE